MIVTPVATVESEGVGPALGDGVLVLAHLLERAAAPLDVIAVRFSTSTLRPSLDMEKPAAAGPGRLASQRTCFLHNRVFLSRDLLNLSNFVGTFASASNAYIVVYAEGFTQPVA